MDKRWPSIQVGPLKNIKNKQQQQQQQQQQKQNKKQCWTSYLQVLQS